MFFGDLGFWFYEVGVNVSPADTKNKMIGIWKDLQTRAQTSEEYEELKKTGAFIRGAAVVTGTVWRGNNVGYYLNAIDLDNIIAIKEVCSCVRNNMTIEQLAESILAEQHPDDQTRLHLYAYSKHPFKDKESDAGKSWFNKETMPAIEVKCLKRIMYCTPSVHQNGSRYKFINRILPPVSELLETKIHDVLKKHDIEYLSASDLRTRGVQQKTDSARTINQGSRHVELLREMNARLHDFIRTKQLEDIKKMCISYNNLYCNPPLETAEFERMWQDAVSHVIQQEGTSSSVGGSGFQTYELSVAEAIRMSAGKVVVKGMLKNY
jgi:hypothetical protein